MKKYTLLLIAFFGISFAAQAQDAAGTEAADSVKWTRSGVMSLNFTNVGLSNWAGGGQSSLALGFLFQGQLNAETEKSLWKNELHFAYGMAKLDGGSLRKTDDIFKLKSDYGYKIGANWYASGTFEVNTQMTDGFTYKTDATGEEVKDQKISALFAPGYLMFALGVKYDKSPFMASLMPVTGKITIVNDVALSDAGAFGVKPGDKMRAELGASLNLAFKKEIFKNTNFETKAGFFANYETLDLIDVNWESMLTIKANKYLSAGYGTHLIYDHDVLFSREDGSQFRGIQFKHVLTLNLTVPLK